MMRMKEFYKILLLVAIMPVISCSTDETEPSQPENPDTSGETPSQLQYTYSETADSLQVSLKKNYSGSQTTYIQNNTGNTTFHYWPNAHALHVLIDAYKRTGDNEYADRAKSLLEGIKVMNGGTYNNVFNDDMLWLGNSSMRAYVATGDEAYLNVAIDLWDIIKTSWSDDIFGGGITWKQDTPYQKNAVSNGPATVLTMRLYDATGDEQYLEWAKKIYEWEKETLVDPYSGLVWDNISMQNGEEVINRDWIFTYNIGTWIGSGLKLYQATGDQEYLDDAILSARSMTTSFKLTTNGIMRDEGQGDGGLFKGILVRYLTQLIMEPDVPAEDSEYLAEFMQTNAETAYKKAIKRPEMFFNSGWTSRPGNNTDLTTQLSGMMLIEAAALLDSEGYFD
ncbi:MAG: glycoside hydrolase family 76 protein [Christiangramia sp.]|uniref:glycoside hydrolase family 76 protein n=1 Tax=Christiangramia sp. TaxID=1931228 RepID=UPI003242BC2E